MTAPTLGLSCGFNCSSHQMLAGIPYIVTATPSQYALLYSLTGPNCSVVSGNCTFTPTGDVTVTARFDHDTAHQVYCIPNGGGQGTYNSTLQGAYNLADPGSTIMAWAQEYSGNLTCDINKTITLSGGYNQGYTSVNGFTTLKNGSLTIKQGRVAIKGVAVK